MKMDNKTNKVWVLTILEDVDDWKRRYRDPSAIVKVYVDRLGCLQALGRYIINEMEARLEDFEDEEEDIPENVRKYLQKDEDSWSLVEDLCVSDEDMIIAFYDWVSEGRYIPRTWRYEIECHNVLPSE